MSDSIISILGLKEEEIEYCKEVIRYDGGIPHRMFYVRLVNHGGRCRKCGTFTKCIKEYRQKKIDHSIIIKEKGTICYSARRFKCPKCGNTFYEDDPFESQYRGISDITVFTALKMLKDYNQTFSSVAKELNITKSECMKIFDEHVQISRRQLSECVAMDEFYFSRHAKRKYGLMILSLDRGHVIDLRDNREKKRIISYFRNIPKEERNKVRYFSIDMNDNFREAVQICFPNARICADPFHVIKYMNKAIDDIRLRILRKFKDNKQSNEYYLLKYRKDLLWSDPEFNTWKDVKKNHHFKYRISEIQMQEMTLAIHPDLHKGWHLKERYMAFNSSETTPEDCSQTLDQLIDDFISSDVQELISFGLTLTNWKSEILNSFNTIHKKITVSNGKYKPTIARVTSGPIEGRNKYIKIILRLANGYQNFSRFRNRAMYVLNKYETYSEEKLDNNIVKHKTRK